MKKIDLDRVAAIAAACFSIGLNPMPRIRRLWPAIKFAGKAAQNAGEVVMKIVFFLHFLLCLGVTIYYLLLYLAFLVMDHISLLRALPILFLPWACGISGLSLTLWLWIDWPLLRLKRDLKKLQIQLEINKIMDGPDEI
jgi:hypothetical protein